MTVSLIFLYGAFFINLTKRQQEMVPFHGSPFYPQFTPAFAPCAILLTVLFPPPGTEFEPPENGALFSTVPVLYRHPLPGSVVHYRTAGTPSVSFYCNWAGYPSEQVLFFSKCCASSNTPFCLHSLTSFHIPLTRPSLATSSSPKVRLPLADCAPARYLYWSLGLLIFQDFFCPYH